MRRVPTAPRPDWQRTVESQGMHYHTLDGEPYWDESAYYLFSPGEVDEIEAATQALNEMCLEAVAHVVEQRFFAPFDIPERYHDFLVRSWETDERTVYGRFDLVCGGGPPKMLEFNADTPTALLEAAVIQWYWLKDCHPDADQFNSIHERLIEAWQGLRAEGPGRVSFTSLRGNVEDYMTVNYLRDTAAQAGLDTEYLAIEDVGWNAGRRVFVDLRQRPLHTVFKLYPWEWMLKDEFGQHVPRGATRWLEPPWKMLLSNKAILAVLSGMFPDSPYLLRASFEPFGDTYARKPIRGREGANVALVAGGRTEVETDGPYGDEPCVYQELARLPSFDGNYAVVGSWTVNGHACGLGIREDGGPVTRNTSRFVPHLFRP